MAMFEPAKVIEYQDGEDPKEAVLSALGNALDGITLFQNDILLVTAPVMSKTKGGIIRVDQTITEERFQGKIGLIVALGETAFNDEDRWPNEDTIPVVGDWVFYRTADTNECKINGMSCRFIKDTMVKGKATTPDAIR